MLEGLNIVLLIFFSTLVFALPIGLIVAFMRISRYRLLRFMTFLYILLMRGTPLLLQLIVIYYGLPLVGVTFNRFNSALIAFSFNYAAYFAEIFRGGLQAIDRGQFEAARTLGFSLFSTYRRIVLPQVFKNVLPSLANEIMTLVKDTSLVYILGLNDILRIAQIASNREASLLPLLNVGLIYLGMIAILSFILSRIEKYFSYYR